MDGHEREDIKKQQQDMFFLKMAKYEDTMVKQVPARSELIYKDAKLGTREKRIVSIFEDKSLFHANEYKAIIWQILETLYYSK